MKGIPAGQVSWGLTFQSPALPSGCHLNLSITLLLLLQLYEDPASIGGLSPSPPYCLPPATCLLPASLSFSLPERQRGPLWSRPGCQLGHSRYTQWGPLWVSG